MLQVGGAILERLRLVAALGELAFMHIQPVPERAARLGRWGCRLRAVGRKHAQRLRQHVDEILKVLKPYGIVEGFIEGLGSTKYPRAFTMYGMARDHLRRLASTIDATWSIQNGKLDIVKNDSDGKPGGAFVLNANTGLIGMPTETPNGIMVTALINPQFFVNGRIKIDEKSIQRGAFSLNWAGDIQNSMLETLGTADGIYRILAIDWLGDSRGGPWYAYLTCIGAVNGQIPIGQTGQGRGGE